MAEFTNSDSWWWDSHISPKNSKWLEENLTDMDPKVKVVIKLLDEDSFKKRPDMYYKQQAEVMKLGEEFYRAHRALAERYDHATGVIRQAHHTTPEGCQNQFPSMFGDNSLANSGMGTPETSTPNGEFIDDHDAVLRRKVLNQVKKGLLFDEVQENEQSTQINHVEDRILSKTDDTCKCEDVLVLKEALAKLEAEKEAALAQYQQSLDTVSKLKAELSRITEYFRVLTDHANDAEREAVVLKIDLTKLKADKEACLAQYQQSLDTVSKLKAELSQTNESFKVFTDHPTDAEREAVVLKKALVKLKAEKEAGLAQYQQSLGTVSKLEAELSRTNESLRVLTNHATDAEREALIRKKAFAKLEAEKEAVLAQYQQSLDTVSKLETELSRTNESFRVLTDHATDAEREADVLKKALTKLEAEKEAGLSQYQQSLDTVSKLKAELSRRNEFFRVHATDFEREVVVLRKALTKLKAAEEASLAQYQQSLGTVSKLEAELSRTNESLRVLTNHATGAEREALIRKKAFAKLEAEKEAGLAQYQQSLDTVSKLKAELSRTNESFRAHATLAEGEAVVLTKALAKLKAEKEAGFAKYQKSFDTVSKLKAELSRTNESFRVLTDRATNAEREAVVLKELLTSFSSEKANMKKYHMMSARDLYITWSGYPEYWRWISFPKSSDPNLGTSFRFSEVAELLKVSWFEIRGKISTKALSLGTNYAAYLVFISNWNMYGFNTHPAETSVWINGQEGKKGFVCLDPNGFGSSANRNGESNIKFPKKRNDGWMEVELGELFVKAGEEGDLEMTLKEVKVVGKGKRGIIIEGIEIRPKEC